MKNKFLSLVFVLTAISQMVAFTPQPFDFFKKIDLLAGTPVSLETAEKVLSDQVTVGQLVKFKVITDVVVDGRVVIRTGAIARGRVKSISENTYNSPESITVELVSVQAVDGQTVALNGDEQTYRGVYPNEGTLIHPGYAISANVMNDMVIKAN